MYHVTVVTGNKTGAGTDSDVFLQMFGEKDDSGRLPLLLLSNPDMPCRQTC